MLDDSRVRKALMSAGLLTEEDVKEVEAAAFRRGETLYRTAITTGHINETSAVAHVAGVLGVPSVSLAKFTAKPKLLDILPVAIVRKYRVLPVGLKPRNGEKTLFVAMDDPKDLDALEAVSQHCTHPVVPLLAGPIDLDHALDRIYPGLVGRAAAVVSPPVRDAVSDGGQDILTHALHDLGGAETSDVISALSLLDDIPRNRHDQVTSPGGFRPIRKRGRLVTDLASTLEAEQLPSSIQSPSPTAALDANDSSGFQRSGSALGAGLKELLASEDGLAAALARVLIVKGVISISELKDAFED